MLPAAAVWFVFGVMLEQPDPTLSIIMLITGSAIAAGVAAASGKALPGRTDSQR